MFGFRLAKHTRTRQRGPSGLDLRIFLCFPLLPVAREFIRTANPRLCLVCVREKLMINNCFVWKRRRKDSSGLNRTPAAPITFRDCDRFLLLRLDRRASFRRPQGVQSSPALFAQLPQSLSSSLSPSRPPLHANISHYQFSGFCARSVKQCERSGARETILRENSPHTLFRGALASPFLSLRGEEKKGENQQQQQRQQRKEKHTM